MLKYTSVLLIVSLLICVTPHSASADDWRWHRDGYGFHDHDFDHWRGGSWYNGFHDGRNGWWWIVDGSWYFYPAPIYPYPDPYTPPGVVVEAASAGAQVNYYCANPAGYYPNVTQCPTPWQHVVSTPQAPMIVTQAPPTAAPQPAAPVGSQHDVDVQQLNVYAAKLQNIDLQDSHAGAALKALDKQVETFRKSLYTRDYNAMDVLKDAEDLKSRIADKKAALVKHVAAPSAQPTAALPPPSAAPATLPAGTQVTFPPQ